MSNDPLPLPDILAAPLDDADYEALYAEIAATARGLRFLTEYASRNRHAGTHMPIGTIEPVEAAMQGDTLPQRLATLCRDLIEMAAAIERVGAEVAVGGTPTPDGVAAIERIQDVAFALREREVDVPTCDALEDALREVNAAVGRGDAVAERARSGAVLLRDLASRVNTMIALTAAFAPPGAEPLAAKDAEPPTQPDVAIGREAAGDDALDRETPPAELSDAQAQEDDFFARVVAALSESLPALAEPGESGFERANEPADITPSSLGQREEIEPLIGEPIPGVLREAEMDVVVPERTEPVAADIWDQPATIESWSVEPIGGALREAEADVGEPERPEPVATETLEQAAAIEAWSVEPIAGALRELEADVVEPERPEPMAAGTLEHPATIESWSVEPIAGDLAETDPIESAAVEREPAGAAAVPVVHGIFASSEGEPNATPDAATATREAEQPLTEFAVGDAGDLKEPPHRAFSSDTIEIEMAASEVPSDELVPSVELPRQESPNQELSSEATLAAEPPSTEAPNAEAASVESSVEKVRLAAEVTESADQSSQRDAKPEKTAVDHLVGDDAVGNHGAERFDAAAMESSADVLEPRSSGKDGVGSPPESGPVQSAPPAMQPQAGPDEDPGDLFDPAPSISSPPFTPPAVEPVEPLVVPAPTDVAAEPGDSGQIARFGDIDETGVELMEAPDLPTIGVGRAPELAADDEMREVDTSDRESASRVLSTESPAPALSIPSADETGAPSEAPSLPPRAAAVPIARAMARPAPSDPLAAILALSEEELTALFS